MTQRCIGPQHSHFWGVRILKAQYFKHYFSRIPPKKEPSGVTVHHYWPYSPWAASGDVDGSLKPVQGRFSNHDAQPKTPPTIIWPKIIIIHQYFPEIAGWGFPLLTQLPFWGKKTSSDVASYTLRSVEDLWSRTLGPPTSSSRVAEK